MTGRMWVERVQSWRRHTAPPEFDTDEIKDTVDNPVPMWTKTIAAALGRCNVLATSVTLVVDGVVGAVVVSTSGRTES